eukprot:TRINITY_DN5433_c0_g1_i3.p1 TRINITY_DN5433_c0_g1~~TRINITY_DN5433_c0_g1_i3.p1  ORF type:complete len:518 (-),score=109.80 TRINITY_DN5433_c0_g1_i3:169-1722(-)
MSRALWRMNRVPAACEALVLGCLVVRVMQVTPYSSSVCCGGLLCWFAWIAVDHVFHPKGCSFQLRPERGQGLSISAFVVLFTPHVPGLSISSEPLAFLAIAASLSALLFILPLLNWVCLFLPIMIAMTICGPVPNFSTAELVVFLLFFATAFDLVLRKLHRSFTFGEAFVVSFVLGACVLRTFGMAFWNTHVACQEVEVIDVSFLVEFSSVFLVESGQVYNEAEVCLALVWAAVALGVIPYCATRWSALRIYGSWAFSVLFVVYPVIWTIAKKEPFSWLLALIMSDMVHLLAIPFWSSFIVISVWFNPSSKKLKIPNIIVRKIFHLMCVVMFTPFAILAPKFLLVAFSGAFAVFIVLEYIRAMSLPPVGKSVEEFYQQFVDSRDQGVIVTTHIYLLAGCAIPLGLTLPNRGDSVAQFLASVSGIAALGVGDSAASFVGMKWGRVRWPQSKKSLEGTAGSFCSMTVYLLLVNFCVDSHVEVGGILVSALGTSLLEAFTVQIDNLFLPVFGCLCVKLFC